MRQIAKEDPRHFISVYSQKVIIDEIQQVPELLSYLQTHIDSVNESGMYVLTGSHNLLLMQSISQSLAGRTALLTLAPFSATELRSANLLPQTTNEMLFKGCFPRIYDKQIDATDFYPSYIKTYIDRDVRILRNITDYSAFTRFLKLCAGRCSQILNVTALAEDAGITRKTAEAWLSVLEASYIIYLFLKYKENQRNCSAKSREHSCNLFWQEFACNIRKRGLYLLEGDLKILFQFSKAGMPLYSLLG